MFCILHKDIAVIIGLYALYAYTYLSMYVYVVRIMCVCVATFIRSLYSDIAAIKSSTYNFPF